MKVINAHWEERNLGHKAVELIISEDDFEKEGIFEEIEDCSSDYTLIKLPVKNLHFMHKLQDMDFYFLETQIELCRNINNYETPAWFKRFSDSVKIILHGKDKSVWKNTIANLEPGMYSSDRFYLDPIYTPEVSFKRYKNWSEDLFNLEGCELYTLNLGDKEIGQGIIQTRGEQCHSILGGIYNAFQGRGLGAMVVDAPLKIASEKGVSKCVTSVSSNNLILRFYINFGYSINNMMYVLRRSRL